MTRGECAKLKVDKTLCIGEMKEEKSHLCDVLQYDEKKECIYLRLQSSELTEISPDVVYFCEIGDDKEKMTCTGRVRERYNGKHGKTVKFQIENGFYKINTKSLTNK